MFMPLFTLFIFFVSQIEEKSPSPLTKSWGVVLFEVFAC